MTASAAEWILRLISSTPAPGTDQKQIGLQKTHEQSPGQPPTPTHAPPPPSPNTQAETLAKLAGETPEGACKTAREGLYREFPPFTPTKNESRQAAQL